MTENFSFMLNIGKKQEEKGKKQKTKKVVVV